MFDEEMTTMVGSIDRHSIAVSSEPLFSGEPFFKYFEKARFESKRAACISLLDPRYVYLCDYSPLEHYRLTLKQKNQLMSWMYKPWDLSDRIYLTNWQALIITFNRENVYHKDFFHYHEWQKFTQKYINKHAKEVLNSQLKYAIPIDYPVPNYLLLS